jgi:hypothetical protein
MRSRTLLWLRRVAFACVALALCLAVFGLWCSQTEGGRRFAARRIERLVTANIPGRLTIGKLTRLGFGRVEAQEVRIYHPDGRCVLRVDEAEVDLELADAWNGRLSFERAVAHGGFMLFSTDPDDRLSFEAAVNAPHKPGEPNVPNGGLHYAMRNMRAESFALVLKLGKLIDYRVVDVNGLVTVQRIDTPGTQVLLADIRGRVEQEIAGAHVTIKQLDGKITGKAKQVAALTVTLHIGDGDLRARLGYFDREKNKLELHVLKKEGLAATTMTWLLEAVAGFSKDIRVEG